MEKDTNRIYPFEKAGSLQSGFRKLLQNPKRILSPYIKENMVVLDIGCGPGFFTIEAAKMVGPNGKVIAADVQQGMLDKLEETIKQNEVKNRIVFHKCEKDKIGVSEWVDVTLAVYVAHETPDQEKFFEEIKTLMKPNGVFLLIEPRFVVSKEAFEKTKQIAKNLGFTPVRKPKIFMSRAVVYRLK